MVALHQTSHVERAVRKEGAPSKESEEDLDQIQKTLLTTVEVYWVKEPRQSGTRCFNAQPGPDLRKAETRPRV